jgi:hypothetical protein
MLARIRTIKPEFFKHGDLFDAEKETGLPLRLAFAGIWCLCDREGRFRWKPREIKLDVLPYDDVDFSRVLDALATRGFLVQYECDGVMYGWVPSFKQHQSINNKESASVIPAFEPKRARDSDASATRGSRDDHAPSLKRREEKRREEKRREEYGDCSDKPSEDAPMSEPYGTVYRVLLACDDREPPESKVKRYLGKASPIRGLVKQYGEADAIRLIKWAAKHKRVGVAVVYGNSGVWWQEANDCNWGAPPERGKKSGWGDPAEDIRKMTEDLIRG